MLKVLMHGLVCRGRCRSLRPRAAAIGLFVVIWMAAGCGGGSSSGGNVVPDGGEPLNSLPTAVAVAAPESGTPPLTVNFDGGGSFDSDGTVATYQWDFDDGGTATGLTPSHTFEDPGDYEVSLVVTDDDGLSSEPAVFTVVVTQDPDSLSFRDFFDTDSVDDYDVVAGAGQSVTYEASSGRMQVTADLGIVDVSRGIPAQEEAFFQIRFLPTRANSSAASFILRLEENEATYYEVWARESVESGEPSGGIRKVVNGTSVAGGETEYPSEKTRGYTNDLAYSINVYFSPERMTAEFTELAPRVLSIDPPDGSPIKVGHLRIRLQDQDAYLDGIIKEPIDPSSLTYYVAFGDSITEGTGDGLQADGRGYPILLQEEFQDAMITSHVVFNEGFGGLRILEAADLIDDVMARHPRAQFVTVMIGTNDRHDTIIDAQDYRDLLGQILESIRNAGKTPYVAKLPHANPSSDGRIDAYNQAIDDLIVELNSDAEPGNDIIVVPPDFACFFDNNPSLMDADEIHPTGFGYRGMAQLWFKMIDLGLSGDPADACDLN